MNVVKPTDGATSSVKRCCLGKSLVHSSITPMVLDCESDDVSEGKNFETSQSKSKSAKTNADKFLKVGKKIFSNQNSA